MRDVAAIIFDYNGVLVLDFDVHAEAYMKVFEEEGHPITMDEMKSIFWMSARDKVRFALGKETPEEKIDEVLKRKGEIFASILPNYNIIPKGLEEVLEKLSSKYKLGIASNCSLKDMRLEFGDFMYFFKVILTAEDVRRKKPDPYPLLLAAEKLGSKPEECAYVGDAPTDMEAAINAGMLSIGIPTGVNTKEELEKAGAGVVVNNLNELKSALRKKVKTDKIS
ncbi:MAG: HAD family hydrolase [Candidatus Micrarchaeota archaeon]|nr:HAD family hydrolase [Candidatus Micrarchaeota archaeon]